MFINSKGSVQILMINLGCGPKLEDTWTASNIREDTEQEITEYGKPHTFSHSVFRNCFAWDTMTYPFSAVTSLNYVVVALIFVVTGMVRQFLFEYDYN